MKQLARKIVATIMPYVAGKPIDETKRELGLKDVIKLASNENALGASPMAVAAIKRCAGGVNRYPDSNSFYLKKRLALQYSLEPTQIVVGNGSDELIDIIIKTFVEEDENIVTADVTFLEYKVIASVYGRTLKFAPLKEHRFDLETLFLRIDAKTKLVFIANPNNPTGTYVTKTELEKFLNRIPDNVIVVIDEAYDIFVDACDFPDSVQMIGRKNLMVLKTFSKSYGLAGLRVGACLTTAEFAANMEKVRQPFNVNLLAQEAALAALDDDDFLKKTRKFTLEGKKYFYKEFSRLGLSFVPSVANFVLFDAGRDGVMVFKELLKQGVIVRDMKQYGLNNFLRVTIGLNKENRKFIAALTRVLRA